MNIRFYFLRTLLLACIVYASLSIPGAKALDLTSSNFIVRDPLVGTGGGYGTATNFSSYISGDMTMIGRATSASYEGRYGFLWYPYATRGTFTAVANGSNADLSWTPTMAGLGWNISGYTIGASTAMGGPYTYTSVGNVTSYSYTNLTPGQYCYILQSKDAFNNTVATSPEQCITIVSVLTFSLSTNSVGFGTLSPTSARYATTTGGSSSNTTNALTMNASSNASNGYTISYRGPLLNSNGNTIPGSSSITGSGTQGVSQFGMSVSTTGSATVASGYQQSVPQWSFSPNVTTAIATTSGSTSTETYGVRYISNVSANQPAGSYTTQINYVITGNF